MRAFVFPGQGSQFVGMGKDLYDEFPQAKAVFEEIDAALDQKLSTLIFEGPESDLNLTENTQPALMATSMAIVSILTNHAGLSLQDHCAFMAGHSLGEYSALTAAGTFSLTDTARLLKTRGLAMQEAVPVGDGAMAAILGMDLDVVQDVVKKAAAQSEEAKGTAIVCQAANDNSVGQVVVSGHVHAVETAVELAQEQGAKKAVMLQVSAPFHCSLMAPAAQRMSTALADADMQEPCVSIVSNVSAKAESDPATIRQLLVDQVTDMVRWRESILWMKAQGVTEIIELGAGKVLSGLIRRIDRDIKTSSVGSAEDVRSLITELQKGNA